MRHESCTNTAMKMPALFGVGLCCLWERQKMRTILTFSLCGCWHVWPFVELQLMKITENLQVISNTVNQEFVSLVNFVWKLNHFRILLRDSGERDCADKVKDYTWQSRWQSGNLDSKNLGVTNYLKLLFNTASQQKETTSFQSPESAVPETVFHVGRNVAKTINSCVDSFLLARPKSPLIWNTSSRMCPHPIFNNLTESGYNWTLYNQLVK